LRHLRWEFADETQNATHTSYQSLIGEVLSLVVSGSAVISG
jgi:hypothetical protein